MKSGNAARVALALALAAGLLLVFANREALSGDALSRWLAGAGAWAPLVFIAFYAAAATVLFLPGAVLTLAADALFGAVPGALYSLTGATLAFLMESFQERNVPVNVHQPACSQLPY